MCAHRHILGQVSLGQDKLSLGRLTHLETENIELKSLKSKVYRFAWTHMYSRMFILSP